MYRVILAALAWFFLSIGVSFAQFPSPTFSTETLNNPPTWLGQSGLCQANNSSPITCGVAVAGTFVVNQTYDNFQGGFYTSSIYGGPALNNGNFYFGVGTYNVNSGAADNTGFGVGVFSSAMTAGSNSAFGQYAMHGATSAANDSAFGQLACTNVTTGQNDSCFGYFALYGNNATGSNDSAFGTYSMWQLTSGSGNTGIGTNTLYNLTTGVNNFAGGLASLFNLTIGSSNVAVGCLYNLVSGNGNSCFGIGALNAEISTSYSTAVGGNAFYAATGAGEVGMGYAACQGVTTGAYNVCIGMQTGVGLVAGGDNLILGSNVTLTGDYSDIIVLATGEGTIRADYGYTNSGVWTLTGGAIVLPGSVKFGAAAFTPNSTTATALTSLGPSGAHTTVQEWLTVQDSSGNTRYIPAF